MRFDKWEVVVKARSGSKHLVLHSRPNQPYLTLTVPARTTRREIEQFLEKNKGWIEAHARPAPDWTPEFAAGERHLLLGRYVTLGEVGVPSGEKAFCAWRQAQLAELASALIPAWAARIGVQPGEIRYREMTSRWGSCQVKSRAITLNRRLAMLDAACVEYVVVHELCHLLVPDHSPAFHALMTRFLPDWKERRMRLNRTDLSPLAGAR